MVVTNPHTVGYEEEVILINLFISFDLFLSGANRWPRSGGQTILPSSYENIIQPPVKSVKYIC